MVNRCSEGLLASHLVLELTIEVPDSPRMKTVEAPRNSHNCWKRCIYIYIYIHTNGIYKQTTDLQYAEGTSEGSFCFDWSQKTQQTKNYRHVKDFQLEPLFWSFPNLGACLHCIHVFRRPLTKNGCNKWKLKLKPKRCMLADWMGKRIVFWESA